MRVKCVHTKGSDLPAAYLDPAGGYTRDRIFPLIRDKTYVVYAITLRRGGVWYYVLDERGVAYPTWNPAPLFDVVDPRLSRFWLFGLRDGGRRDGDAVIAFREWAERPLAFYDALSDGEAESVTVFKKYRDLMDAEARVSDDAAVANELGDGWLMCPKCAETWLTSATGQTVVCPNCRTVLSNPRLAER